MMSCMRRFSYFHLTALLLFWHALGMAVADPDQVPIEAKLVHALQAARVKVGDPVLAKVQVKWQGAECSLREGAIVRGHVLGQASRSKTQMSEIAVLFDAAECDGSEMKALPMTLAALMARDPASDPHAYEPMALGAAIGGIQNRAMDRNSPGPSRVTPSQILATRIAEPHHRSTPQAVKPGDVVGISGVKLAVATGPAGSSVISSGRHNVSLDAATQIVLVANSKPATKVVNASVSVPPARPPEPEPTIDETEICAPPSCSIAISSDQNESPSRAALTIPIKSFGYPAPPTLEMIRFDREAAIAYLGPQQLLLTFNPHTLVARPGLEPAARTMRMVRGVLLDLATMKARKVTEWRVPDSDQYLWPIGNRGVLIHAGRELKLYGPDLKLERSFTLDGPLAFVRASPSGAFIAIGVIHERHSDEIHQQLKEAEHQDPEEDVNVRVVDASFHTIVDVNRSSRAQPPVLSEAGELQTINAGGTRWRLIETGWNREQHVLARVSSTCRPQTASLPPNLLFVVGCNVAEYGRWYRVLGSDGKTLLKGRSPSDEMEQTASASAASPVFAVSVSKVGRPRMATDVFHAGDLKNEYVTVHSADNGKTMLSLSVTPPLPTLQTVALSQDGTQLAVLSAGQIAVYSIMGVVRTSH
jgi:hypothetical protein